jgi:AcrR family transcriptional regulator
MKNFITSVKIAINPQLYLKDPESSELGLKIVHKGIDLINSIGFEEFTFRKLGLEIQSPEASIYRYFESKHKFLLYLNAWYWGWMEYRLLLATSNVVSAEKRLEKAVFLMTEGVENDPNFQGVNLVKLQEIVVAEASKTFLNKKVDQANQDGAYQSYKDFVSNVASIINEINPTYKYPCMLITTVVEGAHQQRFFAEHLPRLTNKQSKPHYLSKFYMDLVLKTIKTN